uniref:RING-type domain-containing protein n=1 Tax=Caenorhabditis tropicalis TaxID=1561998 RepID=A0A1I7U510_9PELO
MGNVTENETPSTPLQYGSSPNQTSEWIDASDASPIVKVHFIKGSPVETLGSHLRFERQSNVAIPLPPPSTTSSSTMITDMGEEEGKESDGEVEESTSSSAPPPTLDIPTSSTETRDAAMATEEEEDDEEEEEEEATPTNPRLSTDNTNEAKRQKKRERKRAKQANKEQQQERQRLQRIQAIRCRQEKLERDAAVVAKEIVDVEEERSRSSSPYSSPEEMAANQPSPPGTFEVLVHGKRRSVVPFVPRRQAPPFEIPKHSSPVVVPFRDAAPILRPMIPFVAYPPPPPPPPPPLLIRPPLPFPTFVSVQPPTFPQPMVPVSMQRIPMQRMPVMINRPPIFLPPPPPPPPPPMLIFPRQLVRPARCPLSITAPEDVKKEEEEKKKAETVRKFMEKVREVALEPAAPEAEEEKEGANATSSSTTVATSNATSSATLDSNLRAATTWEDEYSEETPPAASEATVPPPNVISEATLLVTPIAAPDAAPDATPDAPPTSHQATPTDEPEDPIQLVEKKPKKPESPEPIEIRRRSSVELNGELITAGVAAVLLDDSDDELPPPAASSSSLSQRPPTPEAQEAINRVMEFPKQSSSSSSTFDIWTGFVSEMPTAPKALREEWDEEFREILEKDKRMIEKMDEEGEEPVTLMSICKRIEPFFKESKWHGATIDGEQLREMFIEAYGGAIPRDHWSILELVCSFQPGYFHVFDVVIGSVIELTYNFILTPEFKKNEDSLWRLYQSVPAAEGVEKFFQRFEQKILP